MAPGSGAWMPAVLETLLSIINQGKNASLCASSNCSREVELNCLHVLRPSTVIQYTFCSKSSGYPPSEGLRITSHLLCTLAHSTHGTYACTSEDQAASHGCRQQVMHTCVTHTVSVVDTSNWSWEDRSQKLSAHSTWL